MNTFGIIGVDQRRRRRRAVIAAGVPATYESAVLADGPLATRNLSGAAEEFGGTSATEFTIGTLADANAIRSANRVTLECIVSFDSGSLVNDMAFYGPFNPTEDRMLLFWMDSGTPSSTFLLVSPGGTLSARTSETPVGYSLTDDGTEYHFAATYDGTELKVYVNGTLVSSAAEASFDIGGDGQILIGGDGSGRYLDGTGRGWAIYDTALSDARIAAHAALAF